jgi:hypothetical protein
MRTIEQKRPEPKPEPPQKRATRFRVARALSLESLARDLRSGGSPGSSTQFCASGTVTIPASAQNAGVSFTLYSNKFVNLASSGLNIQVTSDVLATLSNTPLTPNSYEWSLVAPIQGGFGPTSSTLNCVGSWNLNGNITSGTGSPQPSPTESRGQKLTYPWV